MVHALVMGNDDILDAPVGKPLARRIFTIVALLGLFMAAISTFLMNYHMSQVYGRLADLAFLAIPDWVLATFAIGGLLLLAGLIGAFIRKESGETLRWFILVMAGGTLFMFIALLSN
ncbi:MAG: hypothetical protein AAF840_05200 [Bacteroidota bacterium]